MRAAVIHGPRDLRVEQRDEPSLGPGQVKIRVAAGGICGSDLHYYLHGGFGTVRLKEPMILGHEIAGTVVETGTDVPGVQVGQKVAVNPSLPCGTCRYCQQGLQNQCLDMHFYGSAMRMPHVQGGFCDFLVCEASQAVVVPDHVSLHEAAFAEPLAVCLHAVRRAGSLLGARVLVAGAGPIGVLTIAAARLAGAAEIVATDILKTPLAIARTMGADRTVDVASEPDALSPYKTRKGSFDVMFEAAGGATTVLAGLELVRARGILVQVGQGAEVPLPMSLLVTKEIDLRGSFRFHEEFAMAAAAIAKRQIDVRPLLTDVIGLNEAQRAFELAADKSRSMKVHLQFS
jgi:L-idonate 5-dehydrogenase